ncbi:MULTISPECIES: porin [Burkholderia]|uniref:porin n=1 Tax=Burkholderia TaxID=32008 RepID=UPI00064FDB5D|nr:MULTISPECIES: porin [Burkholderia]KMK98349.1 porin [Burkholderia cepacia]KML38827.1 porin [Burkholderia lata]KMN55187.1 porin [Burkholderia sp. LK4]
MRNILLASLLAATAGSVNAQSSVTLFGIVGGGVRWTDGVKGGHQIGFDNNIVSGNSFGMLGTEDLGGGLRAVFKLQSGFSTGTGNLVKASGTLFSQNAYVGLEGRFGRVTMGRQLNAAEDIAVSLDPNGANGGSLTIVPGILWGGNFFTLDARFNNTIKYVGKGGGFTFRVSTSPGGVAGNVRAGSNVAIGASYQYQTLLISGAYEKSFNADASQWAQTALGGIMWQLGRARVYLSYSALSVTGSTPSKPKRRDEIPAAGLTYQISPTLQFTGATYWDIASNLSNVPKANGRKLTSYAMLEYFLSKRTELYVEFDRNGFSGAYKKDPTNVAALNLRPDGRAVTGVSVGMSTSF